MNYNQMLGEQCMRYQKIMEMPAAEREKYAAGIAKLEKQIDELRLASGMDADSFCLCAADALAGQRSPDIWDDDAVAYVDSLLQEAGKCYNIGDRAGMNSCFVKVKLYIGGLQDGNERASLGKGDC